MSPLSRTSEKHVNLHVNNNQQKCETDSVRTKTFREYMNLGIIHIITKFIPCSLLQ